MIKLLHYRKRASEMVCKIILVLLKLVSLVYKQFIYKPTRNTYNCSLTNRITMRPVVCDASRI